MQTISTCRHPIRYPYQNLAHTYWRCSSSTPLDPERPFDQEIGDTLKSELPGTDPVHVLTYVATQTTEDQRLVSPSPSMLQAGFAQERDHVLA